LLLFTAVPTSLRDDQTVLVALARHVCVPEMRRTTTWEYQIMHTTNLALRHETVLHRFCTRPAIQTTG
jgi:hypothetical protein